MKKILTGLAMLTLSSCVLAASVCPSTDMIRQQVQFQKGYMSNKDNAWILISNNISYQDKEWGALLFAELHYDETEMDAAVKAGNKLFLYSPLLKEPTYESSNGVTRCDYTPPNARYNVFVETPVTFGLRG